MAKRNLKLEFDHDHLSLNAHPKPVGQVLFH
jgi:hypothetical protein